MLVDLKVIRGTNSNNKDYDFFQTLDRESIPYSSHPRQTPILSEVQGYMCSSVIVDEKTEGTSDVVGETPGT